MKKQLLIFGILLVLITVVLSGCTQTKDLTGQTSDATGDTDKVEITNYNVTTTWYIVGEMEQHAEPGFYHDYPEDAHVTTYTVEGAVKNIAGEYLDQINITAVFCDANNNELDSKITIIRGLDNTDTKDFSFSLSEFYCEHHWEIGCFKDVDHISFEISVV